MTTIDFQQLKDEDLNKLWVMVSFEDPLKVPRQTKIETFVELQRIQSFSFIRACELYLKNTPVEPIEIEMLPGKGGEAFVLIFEEGFIQKDQTLRMADGTTLIVLEDPNRKWYQLLWEILTWGWYKAPWHYRVAIDLETNYHHPNRWVK
jgi:hypothetical protein